jgi:hypothetical protein
MAADTGPAMGWAERVRLDGMALAPPVHVTKGN